MNSPSRQMLGLVMIAIGSAILISPIRRHHAVWQVTVGDTPARRRVLHGGEYVPAPDVLLSAFRSGDRRPDAEFRFALGLAMIGSGLGLRLTQAGAYTARRSADTGHLGKYSWAAWQ